MILEQRLEGARKNTETLFSCDHNYRTVLFYFLNVKGLCSCGGGDPETNEVVEGRELHFFLLKKREREENPGGIFTLKDIKEIFCYTGKYPLGN